uniref:Transcription initiation factor IIE subunit beta n=1 Tax=Cacopsylla melanoneura TaxID=428564 RepID=A0A8D8Y300_9HEMI
MDPALLRERDLFKKKALSTPTVEKRKVDTSKDEPWKSKKTKKESSSKETSSSSSSSLGSSSNTSYKTMSGSSQYKFGVLAKIVKHMKQRHQDGDDHPLTIDEILDETNQLDVGNKVKTWLSTEALQNNPKLEVIDGNRFLFKSVFKLKDRKGLLKLLKQHDLKGIGGVLLDDVRESLPHCEKALKHLSLQNEIIYVTRPADKRKVMFYNDKSAQLDLDEDFQKLWRSISVDGMDHDKIKEYLEKQGIRPIQDHGFKKPIMPGRKKNMNRKKQFKKPRDNEHLADVLENYETVS